MWKNRVIEREVKANKKEIYTFEYEGVIPKIQHIRKSCGCFKTNKTDTTISIEFKAKPVPKHLKDRGYYFATKNVEIIYADQTRDFLAIKLKISE